MPISKKRMGRWSRFTLCCHILYIAHSTESEPDHETWQLEEEDQSLFDSSGDPPELEIKIDGSDPKSTALSRWIVYFIMIMRSKFKLSDAALSFFLKFFTVFFSILGSYSNICYRIQKDIPSSLYQIHSMYNFIKFTRFVVCKRCHSLYHIKECQHGIQSKQCAFVAFPQHSQRRMRQPCGTLLLKTVELAGGKVFLYPYLTYCYIGLEATLQILLKKPSFYLDCEKWRERRANVEMLHDVYDGKVWKDFQNFKGKPFLSEHCNYALMLNFDFFQPYKYVSYSVGVFYLTILNLPRDLRNKQENVILVGIIPGPREPPSLNSYLKPLVNDLLSFWDGVELDIGYLNCKRKVSCALLCVSCDLPAGRKVCGFLGHGAHLGCSRCLKKFSGTVGDMDYSGFNRQIWAARSSEEHKKIAKQIRQAKSKAAKEAIESSTGYRDTELLKLPYFDASRMLVIDPMHNLFLGTSKHFMKALLTDLFSNADYDLIQQRIDSCRAPPDIGRILHKVSSSFASLTDDQWKNWVVYYSLLVLHDILDENVMKCWKVFALACRTLSSKCISKAELQVADSLLLKFCEQIERIFGRSTITPNMHMHCHLKECIADYGPCHAFWCYAFERYNGILGSMPNNNKMIEIQLMKKFLEEMQVLSTPLPDHYLEEFVQIIPKSSDSGSLLILPTPVEQARDWTVTSPFHQIKMPNISSRCVLTALEKSSLVQMYAQLFNVQEASISSSSVYEKLKCASIFGKQLGSWRSRMASSSLVFITLKEFNNDAIKIARINYFCKHSVSINQVHKVILLLNLCWLKEHPKSSIFGEPTTIWYTDLFESINYIFLPIQFVHCRAISLVEKLDGETVLYALPLVDF